MSSLLYMLDISFFVLCGDCSYKSIYVFHGMLPFTLFDSLSRRFITVKLTHRRWIFGPVLNFTHTGIVFPVRLSELLCKNLLFNVLPLFIRKNYASRTCASATPKATHIAWTNIVTFTSPTTHKNSTNKSRNQP